MEELTLHRLEVLFIIIPIMLPVVFQLLEYEMRCRGSGVRGGGIGEEELHSPGLQQKQGWRAH